MKSIEQALSTIRGVLEKEKFATLATIFASNQPHTTLVAFAHNESLTAIYFITTRSTRKFKHISHNNNISMLTHNCTNKSSDITEAIAVTAKGIACEVKEERREELCTQFLLKHPYMKEMLQSPDTALIEMKVSSYDLVTHFQDVQTVTVE